MHIAQVYLKPYKSIGMVILYIRVGQNQEKIQYTKG